MTTSGVNTFSINETNIIHDALSLLKVLEAGEAATNDDYVICRRFLNMLIKRYAKKMNLWVLTEVTHTLTPGTKSYTVGTGLDIDTAKPLRLIAARRTDTNDIQIEVVSRQEYMEIPTKSTQSACLKMYYDAQLNNGVLYCWPTGDSNNTSVSLTFRRPVEDFTDTVDTPDLPEEAYMALVYNLAVVIGPVFLPSGQTVPPDIIGIAEGALADMEEGDEEDVPIEFHP